MIDVFVARGTGNARGPLSDMCGLVTRKLNPQKFRLGEVDYPATIGRIGASDGKGFPLDVCVDIGVRDLAWKVRNSPNRAGIISYSLGGIVVSRFLEGVERGDFRNANGTKLDVAFVVNIANPSRAPGDSIVPAPGFGLHSSHGKWPAGTVVYELANPRDIICSTDRFSPARRIAAGLSPYAALELNESDPFKSIDALRSTDWLARLRGGSYTAAAAGLLGYLVPYGNPGRTQHTCYGVENVPGTNVTWTDWAAAEINRGWGK
ncbi:hypothetical protein CH276_14105 [Rhodococcus sp. 06-470-2]|uniref:hypothetical protein n=1 Tax=unclassified Rhodococcus (in: high G+C Gram-positive bacteria) TaxID=192944 RepID=UPI000B9AFC7C|nr:MULTISPECIES: hypothetical protein [unclassified Rhodococcus (in: high G+C Gram-positive bacteria)]OZC62749.1 hypothetical protein CH276_14105 [Rhodococcus sp. 06-470-2]OZE71726.1 hypothetical protein CH265_01585 [Rhodococcus sp. 05-2221-1B]